MVEDINIAGGKHKDRCGIFGDMDDSLLFFFLLLVVLFTNGDFFGGGCRR